MTKFSLSKYRRLLVAASVAAVLAISGASYFRIRKPADVNAYLSMALSYHPVWRDFAFRRFESGDSAADLIRRHPPSRIDVSGPYILYTFHDPVPGPNEIAFTGIGAIARDGKLLTAVSWSCTWQFTFFDSFSPAQKAEYAAIQARQYEELKKRLEADEEADP